MLLSKAPVFLLDCQTTGGTPLQGQLLEVAWGQFKNGLSSLPSTFLIQQKQPLPARIQRLTGVQEEALKTAISETELWERLVSALKSPAGKGFCIIHYARFEVAFLNALATQLGTEGLPFTPICTYELAKRLYPELPSHSLRGLSGFLGHSLGPLKRAADHLESTFHIWKSLSQKLEKEHGIERLADIPDWIAQTNPKKTRKSYNVFDPSKLPDKPGVYKMYGAGNRLLYVGKATSLSSRVYTYFHGRKTKGARLNEMISQVKKLKYEICTSPLEAAIRESDQIKQLQPIYNRSLITGKREIWFLNESWQPTQEAKDARWGPFTSEIVTQQFLDLFVLREQPALFESWVGEAIDKSIIDLGVECFEQQMRCPLELSSVGKLLSFGFVHRIKRIKEKRLAKKESEAKEGEETEVVEAEEKAWDAEGVARFIRGVVSTVAMQIFRGRWLRRLQTGVVEWREVDKNIWNRVRSSYGELSFSEGRTPLKRISLRNTPTCEQQFSAFSVETYDRLCVLRTELLRLLKAKASVRFHTPYGQLDNGALERLVFPGHFDAE